MGGTCSSDRKQDSGGRTRQDTILGKPPPVERDGRNGLPRISRSPSRNHAKRKWWCASCEGGCDAALPANRRRSFSLTPPGMEYSFPSIPPLAHAGQPPIRQVHTQLVTIIKPEAGACLLTSPHLHVLATGTHPPCQASLPARIPPDSISDSAWQGWCSPPPSNQVPCTSPIGLTDATVIPAWRVLATRPPAGRNSRLHGIDATPAPIIQPIAWPRLGRLVRFWQCPLLLPSSARGRSVLDHHTRRRHSLVASGGRRSRGASVIGGQSLPDAVASGRKRTKARNRFLSLHLPPMPTPCPFSVCRAGKPFPSWCASTLRGLTIMSWKDHGTSDPAEFDKNKLN